MIYKTQNTHHQQSTDSGISAEAGVYLPEPKDLATLVDLEIELKNNKII